MILYIITFVLSILCFEIGIRRLDDNEELVPTSYLWIGLSMAFPVFLAALRSENIGDDVTVYVIPTFDAVIDAESFLDAVDSLEIEFLYIVLVYAAKFISTDLWSVLMLTELCIVIPFWLAFIKLRDKLNPTFALLVFYCVLYNHTLNMMRQSIALGLIILAVAYMLEKKKGWMLFWLLVALGFHKSSVLGMALPVLYYFSHHYPLYQNFYLYLGVFLGFVFLASSFATLIVALIDYGILDLKYLIYTEAGVFEARVSKSSLVLVSVELLILSIAVISYGDKFLDLNFFFLCGIVAVLFCLTGFIVVFLARISWFFHIVNFLSMAYVFSNPYIFGDLKYMKWGFVLFLCFYWWFAFVHSGESSTIPYEFQYQLNKGDYQYYSPSV